VEGTGDGVGVIMGDAVRVGIGADKGFTYWGLVKVLINNGRNKTLIKITGKKYLTGIV
jgi:hypothetical protein